MARLAGQLLGKPSGKVGDLVFKNLYGKTFIASAPVGFTTPMDTASINRRSKFSFVVKLSAAIIRMLSVKVLWKKSAVNDKSVFNNLFSSAYRKIGSDLDISGVKLYNKYGFVIANPEFTLGASSVSLAADALGATADINPTIEKNISMEGVVYLSSPVDQSDAKYAFLPFSTADQVLNTANPLSFAVNFSAADSIAFQGYTVKKVLAAMVTKDAQGNPVKASMTIFN